MTSRHLLVTPPRALSKPDLGTPRSGFRTSITVIALALVFTTAARAQTPPAGALHPGTPTGKSVLQSVHNLSASGPGSIHATSEEQVCIFCHTPHNASPVQPLWNRRTPPGSYIVYASKSTSAVIGQPTGTSKLCLSCHDGTIALGSVLSRNQPISMAGGITTLPPGHGNLGTDLSDDHPISFRYDNTLTTKNGKLRSPALLPREVHLDSNGEMQCTSCHDAHDNSRGNFLVMDNSHSQLCNTCHTMGTTTVTEHIECAACHQPHSAPSGPELLVRRQTTETCLSCHGGQPGSRGANIAQDLNRFSRHDAPSTTNIMSHAQTGTTCSDCHEPHTMRSQVAVAPNLPGNFGRVAGVTAGGATAQPARFEYEVCFKCHGQRNSVQPTISRQVTQSNMMLQFDPSAVSFHPVETPGKSHDVPSLRSTNLTTGSLIYCADCHTSSSGKKAGGVGPDGTHGSSHRMLLMANYDTADFTAESASAYALCYKCHDRNSILGNQSFPTHRLHVVDAHTPCSACHDAHGISSAQGTTQRNAHLVNFDISIVRPGATKRLEYQSTGMLHGNCTLNCHGVEHNALSY